MRWKKMCYSVCRQCGIIFPRKIYNSFDWWMKTTTSKFWVHVTGPPLVVSSGWKGILWKMSTGILLALSPVSSPFIFSALNTLSENRASAWAVVRHWTGNGFLSAPKYLWVQKHFVQAVLLIVFILRLMPFTVACARRPRVNAPKIQEIFCFYCRNRNWEKSNAVLSL